MALILNREWKLRLKYKTKAPSLLVFLQQKQEVWKKLQHEEE